MYFLIGRGRFQKAKFFYSKNVFDFRKEAKNYGNDTTRGN